MFLERGRQRQTLLTHLFAGIVFVCLVEIPCAAAADPAAMLQGVQIRPSLSLEIIASDNVRRTATHHRSDVVVAPQAGLFVTGETRRLKLFASANLHYDEFLEDSTLNRLTGNLLGHGTLTIVPDFFVVDASAQISDEFLRVADQSPTGLPNGNPQTRVLNTQLSPSLTTDFLGEADATLRASVAEVQFSNLQGAAPSASLSNSTIYQGSGLLTNGARSRMMEWRLSGDYTFEPRADGQDFSSADGLFGLTFRVTPKIHVVGRVGYEMISDPAIPDIRDAIWSGGFSYNLGSSSVVTAERRHSFGRDSWYGNMNLAVSSLISVTGGYEERFENEQRRLSRFLTDIFNQGGTPPPQPSPVSLGENLVNQAFFVKDARLGASYKTEHSGFDLSATLSQREFTGLATRDETASIIARYTETLPANLLFDLTGSYYATLESQTGVAKTHAYTASGGFTYRLYEDVGARLTYVWTQTETNGVEPISEDLVTASVSKTF